MNEQQILKLDIHKLKAVLEKTRMKDRDRKIIYYRCGIDNHTTHTLEATGKLFGVTREAIRLIEKKILDRIGGIDKFIS